MNSKESRMVIRNKMTSVALIRRDDYGDRVLAGNIGNGYVVNLTCVICA